jgi:hypothetical protein
MKRPNQIVEPTAPRHVNTSPKKPRKTALLILGVVGLLVLLCVVFKRDKPSSGILASSDTGSGFPTRTSDDSVSAPVASSKEVDHPAGFSSAAAKDSDTPGDESNGGSHRYIGSLRPPATGSFVATGSASTAFGVVNLERLIAADSSGADSQDARAGLIRDIRRIVAMRAKAHGFAFVFDVSAKSQSDSPFVLATNGVPDITGEVLQELSQ